MKHHLESQHKDKTYLNLLCIGVMCVNTRQTKCPLWSFTRHLYMNVSSDWIVGKVYNILVISVTILHHDKKVSSSINYQNTMELLFLVRSVSFKHQPSTISVSISRKYMWMVFPISIFKERRTKILCVKRKEKNKESIINVCDLINVYLYSR